jgi:glutamyl-tRNA reductase
MHIAVVGLNHRSAPVAVRERLAVAAGALSDVLWRFRRRPGVNECVLVSTCNRTEAYAAVEDSASRHMAEELARLGDIPPQELRNHLYSHLDETAVRHLLRVASGVDSMILGEPQVLGQVRAAYESALASGTTGAVLNRLFHTALETGKRVQTETEINRGAFSVGSAAVELARSIFGSLEGRRVLLLGAGKMSEIVARRLREEGAAGVIIANRTHERARAIAEQIGGRAVRYEDFETEMTVADIVIASTGAPHFIVRREQFERIMAARRMRPMFLIDIAVPRDIDPSIAEIDCAFLYDIDDLNGIVSRTAEGRQQAVEHAERIIEEHVREFMDWQRSLAAAPVIRGLQGRLRRIAEEELERYSRRLSSLDERQQALVRELAHSLVNKITHHPITHIKDYARSRGEEQLRTVVEVFGLDHEEDFPDADWRGDGI